MYLFINLVLSCSCFCCPVALFPSLKHKQIRQKYSNIFGASSEYSNIFECIKCDKSEYEYIFEAQNIRIFEYSIIRAHPWLMKSIIYKVIWFKWHFILKIIFINNFECDIFYSVQTTWWMDKVQWVNSHTDLHCRRKVKEKVILASNLLLWKIEKGMSSKCK